MDKFISFTVCTYNRCERLPSLINSMLSQKCPVLFEVLVINNNSSDETLSILDTLSKQHPGRIRIVTESQQGIAHARNRAIAESLDSDYMVFIDDDEIPHPGLLSSAIRVLETENADCAGGRIVVDFSGHKRPLWLTDDLLGFLAEVDYGELEFWIINNTTPVWTANVAYNMEIFRRHPDLRFDIRFNREGNGIGGGEDAIMFRDMMKNELKIRYCPEMITQHFVEEWRLKRRYFLKLHFIAGIRYGQYQLNSNENNKSGFPLFLFRLAASQLGKTILDLIKREPNYMRQAMNFTHSVGTIYGQYLSRRKGNEAYG